MNEVSERFGPNRHLWRGTAVCAALVFVAAACAGSPRGGGSPSPGSPTPTGPPKSIPALQLAVLAAVGGRLDYCDPDEYPVPRGSPEENARARFPMIKQDRAAFAAILEHEGLSPDQEFTDEQLIAINNDYKQMQAIQLSLRGNVYTFSVLVPKSGSQARNERVTGTVSRSGVVKVESRAPGEPLNCPICLAIGVRISTPFGEVPVQELRNGMAVWTTDQQGRRIRAVVLETGSMVAPLGHRVIEVTLADGRSVVASPGHPTADGRTVGDLKPGDRLGGVRVVATVLVGYSGRATFDLLPSGPTGTYFANGVLLGSSLTEQPRQPSTAFFPRSEGRSSGSPPAVRARVPGELRAGRRA